MTHGNNGGILGSNNTASDIKTYDFDQVVKIGLAEIDTEEFKLKMEDALRKSDETIKLLEEARKIHPRQLKEPLDAAWLITLPETTRNAILENRKKNLDILYGPANF